MCNCTLVYVLIIFEFSQSPRYIAFFKPIRWYTLHIFVFNFTILHILLQGVFFICNRKSIYIGKKEVITYLMKMSENEKTCLVSSCLMVSVLCPLIFPTGCTTWSAVNILKVPGRPLCVTGSKVTFRQKFTEGGICGQYQTWLPGAQTITSNLEYTIKYNF